MEESSGRLCLVCRVSRKSPSKLIRKGEIWGKDACCRSGRRSIPRGMPSDTVPDWSGVPRERTIMTNGAVLFAYISNSSRVSGVTSISSTKVMGVLPCLVSCRSTAYFPGGRGMGPKPPDRIHVLPRARSRKRIR